MWSLFGCSRLGTSTLIVKPEAMSSIHVLGLAPIQVDPFVLSVCKNAAEIAEGSLLKANEKNHVFTIVPVDTLLAHCACDSTICGSDLIDAAERIGLDGVIYFDVMAEDPFKRSRGKLFDQTGSDIKGLYNAVVYVIVIESTTHDPVVITRFGTKWGVSFTTGPTAEQVVSDAMDRAYNSVAKLLKD